MTSDVTYHVDSDSGVARITMNRPKVLNALSIDMFDGLRQSLRAASEDEKVHFIRIDGAGRAFSAGLDITQVAGFGSRNEARRFVYQTVKPFWKEYLSIDKPVIAVANGPAYGAGAEIALASDLLVASEHAVFAFSGGRIGALCCVSPLLGPLTMNGRTVVAMNLTGKSLTAKEAETMGLANAVVAEENLEDKVKELLQQISHISPISNSAFKRILRTTITAHAYEVAYRELLRTLTSEDFRKGSKAFAEKTAPEFYS